MGAPHDAFPYKPLEKHPVFRRRQAWEELNRPWEPGEVRMLCPPVDLITPTLSKIRPLGAPRILLIPQWPWQSWYWSAVRMATKVTVLEQQSDEIWDAQRNLNPNGRLFF